MKEDVLLRLYEEYFTYVSDEASRKRLHIAVEATALCLKFVGAFHTAHDRTEPPNREYAHIETDEGWRSVATDIRHEAERVTGYKINCSAGCDAMDRSIVVALEVFRPAILGEAALSRTEPCASTN